MLGPLGGAIMARPNREAGRWFASLLAIPPDHEVLEVGFGPGVLVRHLAGLAGHVTCIEFSE
jgi:16S rRNA A1518/A1519 N6-dimethyltransferase RsmA/KsgA/DIM1 with predicted DNA glycosylase/AP lyase activity